MRFFYKEKATLLFEIIFFLLVMFTIVLPSISENHTFTMPIKPKTYFEFFLFFGKVFILAMFEELIYRVYLPIQMKRFYNIKTSFRKEKLEKLFFSLVSNLFFAWAHLYLGIWNVCFAFIMGLFFSFIYEYVNGKFNFYLAFLMISLIHFFYNSIVFCVLIYLT
ncbi:MAG: CPBP family intramembrane glutamic endopeptidase [Treponema sp.]